MIIREAVVSDIPQMQIVRHLVKENILSNPALVTDAHVEDYIINRGKGWVCEIEGAMAGFAIVDVKDSNVWALFIRPEYEAMGIGKALHATMLQWYFSQTQQVLWLSTDPGTRAETFYRKQGYTEAGMKGNEIKFEMTFSDWLQRPFNRSHLEDGVRKLT